MKLGVDRAWAQDWLFSAAFPLWWERGADHACGGWYDKLGSDGNPLDLPKRLRVQARQAYVYAEAGRLGWDGPWRQAIEQGLEFILGKYRRVDGLFRASVTRTGNPVTDSADLYDQAFVLLAMAAGFTMLGRPPALLAEAKALLEQLLVLRAHPVIGFEESNPPVLPLRSNPHMHLLEALLAWVEAGGGTLFERHAQAIVELACSHLIDPATGAIGEFYDGDWAFHPAIGHVREPGHQFEWAYLLDHADHILGTDHRSQRDRMYRFANRYGIVEGRVIYAVSATGSVIDGSARLWAQTERLRTMLVIAPSLPIPAGKAALADAADALGVLKGFLEVPVRGSWIDRIDSNGTRLDEAAPASSFYHIVTGLAPLIMAPDPMGGMPCNRNSTLTDQR